jgi:hypothetical protein
MQSHSDSFFYDSHQPAQDYKIYQLPQSTDISSTFHKDTKNLPPRTLLEVQIQISHHIISSTPSSFNMAENPSTSSEANPNPLSAKTVFENAELPDALRMLVDIYNEPREPAGQLRWEKVKVIFDTTADHSCDREKAKEQMDSDMDYVVRNITTAKNCKELPMFNKADIVLSTLDKAGIIKCPYRKWGVLRKFSKRILAGRSQLTASVISGSGSAWVCGCVLVL